MKHSHLPTTRLKRALVITASVAAATLVPASAAHAEWYFTKRGAQKVAKDFVSKEYQDTYVSDLTTACRPQGRSGADPRYKYHAWVCAWYDHSDDTYGKVLIKGVDSPGAYTGQVLMGARQA